MLNFIRRRLGLKPLVPCRTVVLTMHSGDLYFVNAYAFGLGQYKARWIDGDTCWSILLEDGKVRGTSSVVSWEPDENWSDEFEFFKKGCDDA